MCISLNVQEIKVLFLVSYFWGGFQGITYSQPNNNLIFMMLHQVGLAAGVLKIDDIKW